ncbi:DUF1642 domain-containing protein [Streptococcus pluranimalium]|uniref:DUF1642 domain-containing protein n=1 Tax=Streptococcus pluranimalium TaxID=82348 RepID=UPI0039FD95CF
MTEFKEGQEVWVKFSIKDPNVDSDGEILIGNDSDWETWAKPEEIMSETNEVELTKEQAEFLESFYNKNKALHYISRVGWGYFLTDNEGKEIGFGTTRYNELRGSLKNIDDLKILLLNALINGYTVKQSKLYTVEIPNRNDPNFKYTILGKDLDGEVFLTKVDGEDWKCNHHYQLTEEEIRKDFEWAWKWAEPVEVK